jgi:hypothetical protein
MRCAIYCVVFASNINKYLFEITTLACLHVPSPVQGYNAWDAAARRELARQLQKYIDGIVATYQAARRLEYRDEKDTTAECDFTKD